MADADRLTFTLSTGGDVVIKLRPDLAPGHVERITELASSGFYDGVAVPPRDPRLHGPGRRPDRHRHQRLGPAQPQGRILAASRTSAAPCSMARTHDPEQRQQPVLHLLRRRRLPRQPIYRLGRGRERHGACRRASRWASRRASPGKIVKATVAVSSTDGAASATLDHRRFGRARRRVRPAMRRSAATTGAGRAPQGPARRSSRRNSARRASVAADLSKPKTATRSSSARRSSRAA